MPMIDLRRTPEPKDDESAEPLYPWGLMLYLDNETLDKLGMSQEDFRVGTEYTLTIVARATGISSRETEEGSRDSVDLQVTKIEKPSTAEGRAERLFGGRNAS